MSHSAIRVENLGKLYHIGRAQARYRTLRESLASSLSRSLNLLRRTQKDHQASVIWALRDVSFNVQHGEVIGVIGRNGAGKSTLLKILSRITYPTTGFVDIYGRVGSLLEVGTGFHPELTGRENIYLNGAVLGMRKVEIDRRFDEIVSFAEIEQFLDTPVKRYSSGMYVRLAFSVAAHLEPEILLVDEVLAVGDMEFQKKCLGKMDAISRQERTVFFVSHNLPAIQRLCAKVLVLKKGHLEYFGPTEGGVAAYLADIAHRSVGGEIQPHMHRTFPPDLEVYQLELLDDSRKPVSSLEINAPFIIRLACRVHQPRQSYRIGLVFRGSDGSRLCTLTSTDHGLSHFSGGLGEEFGIEIQTRNIFLPGTYTIDIAVKSSAGEYVDIVEGLSFNVSDVFSNNPVPYGAGFVKMDANWQLRKIDGALT